VRILHQANAEAVRMAPQAPSQLARPAHTL
jgi:hypothetical protein